MSVLGACSGRLTVQRELSVAPGVRTPVVQMVATTNGLCMALSISTGDSSSASGTVSHMSERVNGASAGMNCGLFCTADGWPIKRHSQTHVAVPNVITVEYICTTEEAR